MIAVPDALKALTAQQRVIDCPRKQFLRRTHTMESGSNNYHIDRIIGVAEEFSCL